MKTAYSLKRSKNSVEYVLFYVTYTQHYNYWRISIEVEEYDRDFIRTLF